MRDKRLQIKAKIDQLKAKLETASNEREEDAVFSEIRECYKGLKAIADAKLDELLNMKGMK